jgi:uncharacterized protein YijF (DUF1287 family)
MKSKAALFLTIGILTVAAYFYWPNTSRKVNIFTETWLERYPPSDPVTEKSPDPFLLGLAKAAESRAKSSVRYDGRYLAIPYPGGDVPAEIGVCSDEVVRTYRLVGIDLQKEVHEDMLKSFEKYPKIWGLKAPDSNIDHRRVPNLMTFFGRHGETLSITADPKLFQPGEIVAWELSNGLLHIGLVVTGRSADGQRPLILHNIGAGPKIEDALFVGRIVGHFRYDKE